jgi:hypothetical protein
MFLVLPVFEAASAVSHPPGPAACRLHRDGSRWTGSCGMIFDEIPTLTLAPAKAITTGVWREGARPKAVWAGAFSNAGDPDFPVEIEVYGGGGVMRSEFGWHAITGYSLTASTLKFTVDQTHEVSPNALDRAILKRADALLTSDAVWNRADNRKCPPGATTWSIYCATERATIEVTCGFHHRRPALQLVREIVDRRTRDRKYDHRLMDYNNDPSTKLADVHSLFAEALAQIPN